MAKLHLNSTPTPAAEWCAACAAFQAHGEGKNLSHHTLRYYRDNLRTFQRWQENNNASVVLGKITPAHIREFLKAETRRCSPAQSKHCFTTLRCFFSFLVRDGWLSTSPLASVDAPRTPQRVMPVFTEEQFAALLATCGHDFIGVRDRALLLLLVDTGARATECLSLTLNDIDIEAGILTVMGKGAKERRLFLGQAARTSMREYLRRREEVNELPVFLNYVGVPLTHSGLIQMLRRRGKKASLPKALLHPHALRHSFATMFLRRGGDVLTLQRVLGHTTLTMSQRYTHVDDADVQARHQACSPGDRFLSILKPVNGRKRLK